MIRTCLSMKIKTLRYSFHSSGPALYRVYGSTSPHTISNILSHCFNSIQSCVFNIIYVYIYLYCTTLQTRSDLYVFPEIKLPGLVLNFHIHVSAVSDLYIPMIGPPYLLQELGTKPRSFISGNICFKFAVQCLCSAGFYPTVC